MANVGGATNVKWLLFSLGEYIYTIETGTSVVSFLTNFIILVCFKYL